MTLSEPIACLNCRSPLAGAYCSACGQAERVRRLELPDTIRDVVASTWSLDGRFPRTVRALVRGPGTVARRYVDGARVAYAPPFLFALQTSALWFVALKVSLEIVGQPLPAMVVYGQALNLAVLVALAPVLKLVFRPARQTVAEYLVLLFYIGGLAFLWRAALSLLNLFQHSPELITRLGPITEIGDAVLFFAVTSVALWQFHRGLVRWLPARILVAYTLLVTLSLLALELVRRILG